MKPEGRSSFINRSFRRSFRRKKVEEENQKSPEEMQAEQKAALTTLLNAVDDVLTPEFDNDALTRFLKVRDYDVNEAEKLFRLHINMRKFLMMDVFSEEQDIPEVCKQFGFSGMLGFDKEGNLVRLLNFGAADLKGYTHSLSTVSVLKLLLYHLQKDIMRLREENKRTGRNATRFLYIFNGEHVRMSQATYKPALDTELFAVKLFQEHFYDIVKEIMVINAPSYFSTVYKLFKPILNDDLQKKITVFDNDKWKSVLLEHIDADVLPQNLGGTRVDKNGDPRCSEFINYGGEIPESFYLRSENISDMKTVVIDAGSYINIPMEVKEVGQKFKFCVSSKDHDISLAILYDPSTTNGYETPKSKKKIDQKEMLSKMEPLTPIARCQCHINAVSGQVIAWKTGTHILHLDNTYSWMNPKEVYYKFEMIAC